jgi:hypothetical protein
MVHVGKKSCKIVLKKILPGLQDAESYGWKISQEFFSVQEGYPVKLKKSIFFFIFYVFFTCNTKKSKFFSVLQDNCRDFDKNFFYPALNHQKYVKEEEEIA